MATSELVSEDMSTKYVILRSFITDIKPPISFYYTSIVRKMASAEEYKLTWLLQPA